MNKQKVDTSVDSKTNKKKFGSSTIVNVGTIKTLTNGNKYKDKDDGGSQNGYQNHSS